MLRTPAEITRDVISQRQARAEIGAKQNFEKGLFHGLKTAMAEVAGSVVKLLKKNTYSVKVENQIELPKLQQVEDKEAKRELRELKQQLTATLRGLERLEKTSQLSTKELAKALKPIETDLNPLIKAVKDIKIPETKIPAPLEAITVKNLDELKKPLAELAKKLKIELPAIHIPEYPKNVTVGNLEAVEALLAEISTKTEQLRQVEYPQVDLEPLVKAQKEVKNAIESIRFPIPTLSVPKTGNDHVATEEISFATKITTVGDITYIANAIAGSAESAAVWQAKKIDATTGVVITWADGDTNFNNVATDLTALSYS